MRLLIDTNIYSDYAEGITNTVDYIAAHGEQICIPTIVIGELNYGFMKGSRRQFNESKFHQFLTQLNVEIIGVDANVARKYALIYLSLRIKGSKIPINDVWIAACCMEVGGTLLTKDRHFKAVDQIETIIL